MSSLKYTFDKLKKWLNKISRMNKNMKKKKLSVNQSIPQLKNKN